MNVGRNSGHSDGWKDRVPSWGAFILALLAFLGGIAVTHYVIYPSVQTVTYSTTLTTTATSAMTSTRLILPSSSLITESEMKFTYSGYTTSNYGADFGWWVYNVSAWKTLSVAFLSGTCGQGYTCLISFGSGPCVPSDANLFLCKGYATASDCTPSCDFASASQIVQVTKQNSFIAIFGFKPNDNFTIYASS